MAGKVYISRELFGFLRELKVHNNRGWFLAHKGRYEAVVRDPLLDFIADFAEPLSGISRRYAVKIWTYSPTKMGGPSQGIIQNVRVHRRVSAVQICSYSHPKLGGPSQGNNQNVRVHQRAFAVIFMFFLCSFAVNRAHLRALSATLPALFLRLFTIF